LTSDILLMYFICSTDVRKGRSVFQSPFVPQAALAAGLPARYLYWHGRSGRRYLFTRTEIAALADFVDAVVILVADGEIVFAGGPADARLAASAFRRVSAHVHLLAASAAARKAIAADIAPPAAQIIRLAA
jgi:hypothetical protein